MAASGYTRQALANIQPGLNANSGDINTELNAVANAMDNTSGHDHSGSVTGVGSKIILTTSVTGILPTANGGTGSATVTGTGLGVLQTSPTLLTPVIASITGPTTVTGGALTVSTGGLIVSANGITVTGNSSITGTLTTSSGITVSANGITVTGNSSITGTLTTSGALTVSSGGAAITGTTTVTGTFNATTSVSDNSNRVYSPSNTFVTATAVAAGPLTTTSATGVMAGLGFVVTPTKSTRLFVQIYGNLYNNTAGDGIIAFLRYGTGAAPVLGAVPSGTVIPNGYSGFAFTQMTGGTSVFGAFVIPTIVTGLTLSTTYWFDISFLAVTGGTAAISNIGFVVTEI